MKLLLLILIGFIAFTATISGLIMVTYPDGSMLNLPLGLLDNTPFRDYMMPGLLLAVLVGGTSLAAFFYNLQGHKNRYNWAVASGFIMCAWIITQMILLGSVNWLHIIYLTAGLFIILISWYFKGKWAV